MELKLIIERAEKAAGGQKALALRLGQSAGKLRQAKAGICGLPAYACMMIAEIIGEDETVVLAASELVTEKKPERRAVWEKKLEALAASILLGVILNMTPTPSQAAPVANSLIQHCILCQIQDCLICYRYSISCQSNPLLLFPLTKNDYEEVAHTQRTF